MMEEQRRLVADMMAGAVAENSYLNRKHEAEKVH